MLKTNLRHSFGTFFAALRVGQKSKITMEENKNINEEEIKQETAEGQAEEPTNPENQEAPANTEEQENQETDPLEEANRQIEELKDQ